MSKKEKKPETVQATLDELENSSKSSKTKSKSNKPKTTKKKPSTKKKTKSSPKKKSSSKKSSKSSTKKKSSSKESKKKEPVHETSLYSLTDLPGVGEGTAKKLAESGYGTVEKISRTRSSTLSKKIEGISDSGAKKIIEAAKEIIKKDKTPPDAEATSSEEEPSEVEGPKLTDIPGIGAKLAKSLESGGYTSVGRLSRSQPSTVAKKVDGLSGKKAESIVSDAKKFMKDLELKSVAGETEQTETVKVSKTPSKTKKEKPKIAAKKKSPAKKSTKKAPKPKVKTRERKKPKPPTVKETKIKRSKSGLPVPKAVEELRVSMVKKWKAAEKREMTGEVGEDFQETVEVVSLTKDDTSDRLVEVALDVLNEAMVTGRPAFEIPSRSSDNIVWDEIRDLLLLGMKTISRPYHSLGSVVDATRTARVMEIVFNLLKSSLHATKRELFYSDVNLFREQRYSDKIIEDVASMLQTTRDSIHVVASARGSAMGRVVIQDGGDRIDLTKMGTGGWAITPFLDQVEILESDAEFIILSEKDAAVMRLAEAKYWNRQPCIVLTGKGSGDIATRAFLKILVKELEIPAFALVDSDPYGHYIYSVFLRGSKRLSYESPFIATPELKLLGVLSRDLDEYDIPKSVRIPMEPTDIKRVKDMLKEPFVKQNKEWVEDLKLMLNLKEKAEIQAFASHSFKYLTDEYIPRKLETADWI